MNTIVYDVHLYTRMLYLQRKGNLEGAAVLRELLTNKIEDIQEAVHPQVLARNASLSPREQQILDFDSEMGLAPGVKFGLDPRYINFASRAVSPGPAVHNEHVEWRSGVGGAFTREGRELRLEMGEETPGPSFYRPVRGKCSWGTSVPKLLRRGGGGRAV